MKDRLLLLEDEVNLAITLEFNLREEGYDVDVAGTVAEARAFIAQERYALFLLDVMLPDGDGFELCREIRALGLHSPVLMLTARGRSTDVVEGLGAGADDYVTKPYSLQELLGRIAAKLRRQRWASASSPLTVFAFGNNLVDFGSREASHDGDAVDLTDLEIRLLRYFVDHLGKAVSREELLEHVWNMAATTNTRTVDNFLVRLRRLFEPDPSAPIHFLTVRGLGYRFVAD